MLLKHAFYIHDLHYKFKIIHEIFKVENLYFRYESISANLEKSEREMRFDDHIDRYLFEKNYD